MDANETYARQEMARALQQCFPACGVDAAAQAVIREARLEQERAKARSILDEAELFATVGAQTRDDFTTDVLPALVALGWILGNQQSAPNGPQIRGGGLTPLVVDRWLLDRWLAHFDAAARGLGYEKRAPATVSKTRALSAAVVVIVAALFG